MANLTISNETSRAQRPDRKSEATRIEIAAPDNVRDYSLVRDDGESAEAYEERKQLFDALLTRGGR